MCVCVCVCDPSCSCTLIFDVPPPFFPGRDLKDKADNAEREANEWKANEAESKIQQLEEQLNDVLEMAETNAVKTNEENEAKIK